jgi:hypothetical protein
MRDEKQHDESQRKGEAQSEEKARAATGPGHNGGKHFSLSPKYTEGWAMEETDGRWACAMTPTTRSTTCEVHPAKAANEATSSQTISATGRIIAFQINFFSLLPEPVVK